MPSLKLTTAFNRYGAKLANPQWAVSAVNDKGELVVSCWSHYLKAGGGKLVYTDYLSRWSGNTAGNNLFRKHLEEAIAADMPIRLVKATTSDPELVDSGGDASEGKNTFSVREDVVGRVTSFDGDNFTIEFIRDELA
jgi:hypothetical protein